MGLYLLGDSGSGIGLGDAGGTKWAKAVDTHTRTRSLKQKPFFLHLALCGVTIRTNIKDEVMEEDVMNMEVAPVMMPDQQMPQGQQMMQGTPAAPCFT